MPTVSCGSNTTSSICSSSRAIWPSTVSRPWPHSTAAVSIDATGPSGPADSVTLTSEVSSNPSLYAMFL
jgi:hypothetical protein